MSFSRVIPLLLSLLLIPSVFATTETAINNSGFIVALIGSIFALIYFSNSLDAQHNAFKFVCMFFVFVMFFILGDLITKIFALDATLKATSNIFYNTISWLYKIFATYVVLYFMWSMMKTTGMADGLRGWFKK